MWGFLNREIALVDVAACQEVTEDSDSLAGACNARLNCRDVSCRELNAEKGERAPIRRRPCSLAAQTQRGLVSGDLGDCGSIADKFKSERDLHVVPDARPGRFRCGVLFNYRHRG